jgi:hypothetical protein
MEFVPGTAPWGRRTSSSATLARSALPLTKASTSQASSPTRSAPRSPPEIVAIYIAAAPGNTNDVQLTRPASNGAPIFLAAGDGFALGPGDFSLRTYRNGVAITAGHGRPDQRRQRGAGTSVTYDIVIIGRTVAA